MLKTNLWTPIVFLFILIGSVFVFAPALSGPFLLDDLLHLPKLEGEDGTIDTKREVYQLMFSEKSPTGRPLAFISLLISDNSWPTDPWPFKYTNLMFHLLNGVLVFVLLRLLATVLNTKNQNLSPLKVDIVAFAGMAIWLFHPIHLSSMMMVIQRMTILMATCTLLGLIFYIKGRVLAQINPTRGYMLMSLGIGGFGILGAMFKEPAVMLVCYVIALEVTLFSGLRLQNPPHWRYWYSFFILLPLACVLGYFILSGPYMQELFTKREFNMTERLLTESRVMMDYLRVIFFPSLSATGPYHDDYVISRGLLQPSTTLISILSIFAGLIYSVVYRKRHPLIAFGILWFFLAHILESTVMPIELYFEHRNYLPMLGFVFTFTYLAGKTKAKLRKVAIPGIIFYTLMVASISHASAQVWGNSALLANVWAAEHPASVRSQLDAIRYWLDQHNFEKVKHHVELATKHNSNDAGIHLYSFIIDRCNTTADYPKLGASIDDLRQIIPRARFEHTSLGGMRFIVKNANSGRCKISYEEIHEIIDLYLNNHLFYEVDSSRASFYQEKSRIYILEGNLDKTIEMLDRTYEAFPNYGFALNQAYLLYSAGLYDEALNYIEIAKNTKPFTPYMRLWQYDHIAEIEKEILLAMKNNAQQ